MNPIKVEDLFSPNFQENLDEIINKLQTAAGALSTSIEGVKNTARGLANIKFTSTQAEETKKWANSVLALNDEYKYLLNQFNITKSTLAELTTLERDQNAILKLQQQYAGAAEGSFNKLSAEYRLLKITMNALDAQSLKNTESFKRLQQRAEELYETMNRYQKSTGKYTMQVGDYSRALNGLNLSTQQILREMPTLANSTSQFFMAISNNVPIFIDNFKRAKDELGSFSAALKGTLTAMFSWQTVLLAILTVLPKVAKAIRDKKKAQEEANKESEKAFNIEREMLSLEEKIAKSEKQSVSQLQAIYAITQDVTRSDKERLEAADALQKMYPDRLANLSQEEILAGNAKTAIDDLTNSLVLQARARGYLNEIEDLSQQKAQKELERIRLQNKETQLETDIAKEKARTAGGVGVMGGTTGASITTTYQGVGELNVELNETRDAIPAVTKEIDDLGLAIDDVIKLIPTEGLTGLLTSGKGGSGTKGKETKLGEIPDYIIDYYDALIDATDDAYEKLILQKQRDAIALGIGYEKDYAKLKELETTAIEQNNTAAIAEIRRQMELRTEVYNQEMDNLERVVIEGIDKIGKAQQGGLDDPLREVRGAYVAALVELQKYTQAIQDGLDSGRKIGADELADWQGVIRKKIEAEANYQKAKKQLELQGRLDAQQISQQEYEDLLKIEYAKIDSAAGKAIDKIGHKKGKKWNIWTALFGTDVKDEATGTVTRVIGEDVKFALDQTMNSYKEATKYIDEYIDALARQAQQAIETANTEVDMARKVYESELEARANGYANAVDTARMEYEQKLQLQRKAQKEAEKIQKTQLAMESAAQAANLITATTSIIASYSSLPFVGQALAIAGIATMWATFLAAKIKAAQVTQYGEGMSEYLDYGGSHASGNDIDFGVGRDGRRRRVERGEVIGVINKRNVRRYGASKVTGIIDSLNKGTFDYKYGNAFGNTVVTANGQGADLRKLESGVDALVKQGEYRETTDGNKRIIQYRNLTRIIR